MLFTTPPWGTSDVRMARAAFQATAPVFGQEPLRHAAPRCTGFDPPAAQVREPAFVKETVPVTVAPPLIVVGVLWAPQVTAYCGSVTITLRFCVETPCQLNHVTPSRTRS